MKSADSINKMFHRGIINSTKSGYRLNAKSESYMKNMY